MLPGRKLSNKNGQRKWLYYPGRLQTEYQKRITRIRIPIQCLWHDYLEEGIFYFIQKQKRQISITKELYPAVAEKYSTNAANVERNIRTTIEKVWTRGNLQRLVTLAWDDRV